MMLDRLADAPEDILQLARDWPLVRDFALSEVETLMGPIVVVVGAYQGKAMDLIGRLYPSTRIHGFEPQTWAAEEANRRLAYPKEHTTWVYAFGLGAETVVLPMGEWHTDACSFVNTGPGTREQGQGLIVEASSVLAGLLTPSEDHRIDLMVMNIEGGEYSLIPHLRQTGWLGRIDRLAVQWHLSMPGIPDGAMEAEIDRLTADFRLERDERPSWTYHVAAWAGGDA